MRLYVSCLLFTLVTALLIPISAEAQTDAECVAVYDANGTRIARAGVGTSVAGPNISEVKIFLPHGGLVAVLTVTKDTLRGNSDLFFTSANCTGDAYINWVTIQPQAYLAGTDLWFPDTTASPLNLTPQSRRNSPAGDCSINVEVQPFALPAFNFTLPTFTPPFHLEPEPCFTPPDPDPEQVINACVKDKSGTLRIVADPADCTSRETPITLLSP